jgi:hypothetical protein
VLAVKIAAKSTMRERFFIKWSCRIGIGIGRVGLD